MKKVVIVTTGQPSTNPRMVKEADALTNSGYDVTVFYSFWSKWALQADESLLKEKKWTHVLVGGDLKKNKLNYHFSRMRFKIYRRFPKFFKAEPQLSRNYKNLLVKTLAVKADLYIGHNVATLPIIVKAAIKHNAKCIFDAEDFHRGEREFSFTDITFLNVKLIEDKYIPQLTAATAASPLIAKAYKKLYPSQDITTINNVFPKYLSVSKIKRDTTKLRMFWFSQTVGKNRGLEGVISALGKLRCNEISIHLLGLISEQTKKYFYDFAGVQGVQKSQISFYAPINSADIVQFATNFDVGLALEPGFSINNDIALSNKLFTYLTAGIPVIASETSAQKLFLSSYKEVGVGYRIDDIDALSQLILFYRDNPNVLITHGHNARDLASNSLNWEKESEKLLNLVSNIFKAD